MTEWSQTPEPVRCSAGLGVGKRLHAVECQAAEQKCRQDEPPVVVGVNAHAPATGINVGVIGRGNAIFAPVRSVNRERNKRISAKMLANVGGHATRRIPLAKPLSKWMQDRLTEHKLSDRLGGEQA